MAFRAILASSCCVLLLAGCGAVPQPAERGAAARGAAARGPAERRAPPETYLVRANDTLYSIAWRRGLDYRDIARWNHIGSDFRITVGQVLLLGPPLQGGAGAAVAAAPYESSAADQSGRQPAPPSPVLTALKWAWPTLHDANPRRVPGGGVLIAGKIGQEIRAAGAGRVVYNGNGIRGYGNLIIIRHGERALSAYAHNRDTLVHEGDEVALGQLIAHMGEGAPGKPVLYFEIRLDGKPVDPVAVLTSTISR